MKSLVVILFAISTATVYSPFLRDAFMRSMQEASYLEPFKRISLDDGHKEVPVVDASHDDKSKEVPVVIDSNKNKPKEGSVLEVPSDSKPKDSLPVIVDNADKSKDIPDVVIHKDDKPEGIPDIDVSLDGKPVDAPALPNSNSDKSKGGSNVKVLGSESRVKDGRRKIVRTIPLDPIQIEFDASFPFDIMRENVFNPLEESLELLPARRLAYREKNPSQEKKDVDIHAYMKTVDQRIKSIERQNGFLRSSIDETIRCLDNMQKAIGVFLLWQIVVFFLILLIMIGRIIYMRRKRVTLQNCKEGVELQYE